MPESKNATSGISNEVPELTDAWYESADLMDGAKFVRRGRPKAADPKKPVSLRKK